MSTEKRKPSKGATRESFAHVEIINIKDRYFTIIAIPTESNINTTAITFSITANRQIEEGWRLDRLIDVSMWITRDLAAHHINDIALMELHDHKGELTATVTKSLNFSPMYKFPIETVIRTSWACACELEENTVILFK